jgi:hypothetical protein
LRVSSIELLGDRQNGHGVLTVRALKAASQPCYGNARDYASGDAPDGSPQLRAAERAQAECLRHVAHEWAEHVRCTAHDPDAPACSVTEDR